MLRRFTLVTAVAVAACSYGLTVLSPASDDKPAAQPKPAGKVSVVRDLKEISPAEQRSVAALKQETETGFVDTPLTDAIAFLADLHKLNILLDEAALEEEGIATDEPINLDVSGITLRSALRIMLEPLGLTSVFENEVLQITTQVRADEMLQTRVYDVRALEQAGLDSKALAEVVERTISAGGDD